MSPITNYTICLDRLELMLKDAYDIFEALPVNFAAITRSTALPSYTVKGITLELASKCENKNYHVAYYIIIDDQRFATLYLDRTKFYQSDNDLYKLQLTNRTCYTNWLPNLNRFLTAYQLMINNITYLEISLDTNTDILDQFLYYFEQPEKYHLVSGLKPTEKINRFGELYRNGETNDTFYMGKAGKKLAIYNKTLEIKDSHKYYITDYHKANGLDIDKDIYRMELRLMNNALKRSDTVYIHKHTSEKLTTYQHNKLANKGELKTVNQYQKHTNKTTVNVSVDDLTDANKLSGLFKLLFPSALQFRKADNIRVSRCTDIQFVKFKTISEINYINTVDKTKQRDTNMNKNTIHQILKMYAKTKDTELQRTARKLATEYNLVDYYDQIVKRLHLETSQTNPIVGHCLFNSF